MILIFGPDLENNKKTANKLSLNNSLLSDDNVETSILSDQVFFSDYASLSIDKFKLLASKNIQIIWENGSHPTCNDDYEYLTILKKHQNIDVDPIKIKQQSIITNKNQILFYGCSHTTGGPWLNESLSYTSILANYFNKEPLIVSRLERTKKHVDIIGNFNNFNLLANTDFLKNQILVLQLSDLSRVRFYDDTQQAVCTYKLTDLSRHEVLLFNDKRLFHELYERIKQFINYAREKELKFVFFNLGGSGGNQNKNVSLHLTEYYLSDFKEFIPDMLKLCEDHGTDGTHFGEKSNQNWAKIIIKKIEELY
jgi:hypothetical protein